MGLFGSQEFYDFDHDGELDAGEWELWEEGFRKPAPPPPDEEEYTCTLEFYTDLIQGWETAKTALWQLPVQAAQLQPMLGRAMVSAIIHGISQAAEPVPSEKWHELDQFLHYADDLGAAWTVGSMIAQAESGAPPYPLESELTHSSCGRLWACLLPCITDGELPAPVYDLCWELVCASVYFRGGTLEDAEQLQETMECALLEKSPARPL